jgi:hypothetical protein
MCAFTRCAWKSDSKVLFFQSLSVGEFISQFGDFLDLPENVVGIEIYESDRFLVRIDQQIEGRSTPKRSFAIINNNQVIIEHISRDERRNRGSYSEGLFATIYNGKLGYKDFNGWVIPPVWDDGGDFSDGVASVIRGGERFFISKAGDIVLSVSEIPDSILGKNTQLSDFVNGYARVTDMSNQDIWRTTYINKSGEPISEFHDGAGTFFYEGFAIIQTYMGGPCYFIDEQGKMVESIGVHDYLSRFSGGLAVVGDDKKFGYVNTEGEMVIPKKYNYATPFVDGYAAVSYNEPLRYPGFSMDVTGVARYGDATDEGIGRYAIINTKGEEVVPPIYYGIPTIYEGGVAKVTILNEDGTKDKQQLINLNQGGRVIDESKEFVRVFKPYLRD